MGTCSQPHRCLKEQSEGAVAPGPSTAMFSPLHGERLHRKAQQEHSQQLFNTQNVPFPFLWPLSYDTLSYLMTDFEGAGEGESEQIHTLKSSVGQGHSSVDRARS